MSLISIKTSKSRKTCHLLFVRQNALSSGLVTQCSKIRLLSESLKDSSVKIGSPLLQVHVLNSFVFINLYMHCTTLGSAL